MTITSELSKTTYAGDGSTVRFTVPFHFASTQDLDVVRRGTNGAEATLVPGQDYSVETTDGSIGGTLVLAGPLSQGTVLTIRRDPALLQQTVYEEGVPLSAKAREDALDHLTMLVQANRERLGRAVLRRVTSQAGNIELPDPEAGRAVVWNAAGDGLENGPSVDEVEAARTHAQTASTAREETEAARDEAVAARDQAVSAAAGVNLPPSPQDGQLLRFDAAGAGWVGVAPAEVVDLSPVIRSQNRGFAEVAAHLAMPDISFDNRRLDTFEDASNIDAANSTGYEHVAAEDYVKPSASSVTNTFNLSAATFEDVKGSITQFTVDTANTSGHFNASNTGTKVVAGTRMIISGTSYPITAITNDGDATDEVEFDGTLAAGTYTITAIYGTEYADGVLKLSEFIEADTTTPVDSSGFTVTSTGDEVSGRIGSDLFNNLYDATNSWHLSTGVGVATIELGASMWISGYSLRPRDSTVSFAPTSVQLEYWDGSAWVAADSAWNYNAVAVNLTYTLQTLPSMVYTDKIRLTASKGGSEWILGEMRVFGADSATPTGTFYPITLPAIAQASVSDIVSAAVTAADGGETVVFALSVDGGSTINGWDGAAWQPVNLTSETGWMTEATMEGIADADWPAITGDVILYAGLKTTSASVKPEVSAASMDIVSEATGMSLVIAPVGCSGTPAAGAVWLAVGSADAVPTVELSRDGGSSWDALSLTARGDFLGTMDTYDGELAAFTHADGGNKEVSARLTTAQGEDVSIHFLSVGGAV